MRSSSLFSLSLAALSLTLACADGGATEDAGTTEDAAFGGLDQNGDGALDDADADDGALAIYAVSLDAEGAVVEDSEQAEQNETATLRPGGSGGWYLEATLDDDTTLSIRFENAEALTAMEGVVTNVNLNPVDSEWFGYTGESTAKVKITEVASDGTKASGALLGELVVEQYGPNEQPLGTSITIKAFGFNALPIVAE